MLRYFIYCRKSTEDEGRQVLSIESQMNELKALAEKLNLSVVDVLTESKSAKEPGRPVFNEMIGKIKEGKANGIICWKLDRLARNPLDSGNISWLLQKGIIKHIQTYDRAYYPEDNVVMKDLELSMANQYIIDLSKNVKRGLKTKAEKGWRPGVAPLGYLNDKSKGKGLGEIITDPERFNLVKKLWELMLKGNYTPPNIAVIANDKWGFRTPKGKPLARATIYRIFTNPFYCGMYEYPKGSGNWHQGKHESMITFEQYDRVQKLLGRKGNPRPKKREFAFRGIIKCGECGGTITPDEKNQVICSVCKYKFSSNNTFECPKCKTLIENMEKKTLLHYVYYRCTKRQRPDCSQGSVEIKEMERQIDDLLSQIQISERFKDWAIKYLRQRAEQATVLKENILSAQKKAYDNCLKKISNLFQLKISPLNVDGSLLSDEEFAKQKAGIVMEKARLEEALKGNSKKEKTWLDIAQKAFDLACHARQWFRRGNHLEKERILHELGSNLVLKDKKLLIELKKPYTLVGRMVEKVPEIRCSFEPKKWGLNELKLVEVYSKNLILRRGLDDVRTWIMDNLEDSVFFT